MNVAIIGAGISGLSCAYELKQKGINPVIFEKQAYIAQNLNFITVLLELFGNSVSPSLKYLKKKYNIALKDYIPINKITMRSNKAQTTIKGNLGQIFIKGRDKSSLENQLYKLSSDIEIQFDTVIESALHLKNSFDKVIVANRNPTFAKELGLFSHNFNSYSKIASIVGNFSPGEIVIWLNTEFAKNCFAYLIPTTTKKAFITLIVNNVSHRDLEYYWKKFLAYENFDCDIIETYEVETNLGSLSRLVHDNIYFVGEIAGCTDNFLGFGAINCIESGIMAAKAITENDDYELLMKPILKKVSNISEIHKLLYNFENKDFDLLIKFIGLPGIKQLIYSNPFAKVEDFGSICKFFNKLKKDDT